jgi:hypothetical protein
MRDPHLSSELVAVNDAGFSVVAASRAYAPALHGSSLANELRLYTVRPNVLVIGPVALVEAMLSTITAMLLTPVSYWTADVPLSTLGVERTVVIREVATWCLDRQEMLLTWLSEPSLHPQVIATSSIKIFPLVAQGLFLEALYYRLNTILLDVGRAEQAA